MKEAVKAYSIDKGLAYKVELSNKSIWVVNCRKGKEKCRWHFRARLIESEDMWRVVKYRGPHECFNEADEQNPDHVNLDCNLIAENIKELVKAQPNLCVAAIRVVIKEHISTLHLIENIGRPSRRL
jgi:hypothetical protein